MAACSFLEVATFAPAFASRILLLYSAYVRHVLERGTSQTSLVSLDDLFCSLWII